MFRRLVIALALALSAVTAPTFTAPAHATDLSDVLGPERCC